MKGLKALLWKDQKLFRTGAGLVSLVLPLLLLCLLRLGMGDTLRNAYVQPFPIAIRDRDQTVMSRSLVGQIGQVDLFSQVLQAGDEEDQALLDRGCAAVLTIPKDFFYDMYTMDNALVEVTLNREMPLEASLLRSALVSVMDIISADQAAGLAVFRFCYGDLSGPETDRLWAETSQRIVLDALGRQQLVEPSEALSDPQGELELRLLACALSLICLFFPLSTVKTLPQELSSGILPRWLAVGGRPEAFLLSKLLSGLFTALPSLALILLVFPQRRPWMTLLSALGLYLLGFSLQLCLSAWSGDAAKAQRRGNPLLLLSLMLGGVLCPAQLLPLPAQWAGRLTLPYWALRSLGLLAGGAGPAQLLAGLWPVWVMSAALLLLSLPGLRRLQGTTRPLPGREPSSPASASGAEAGRRSPLLPLSGQKVKAMSGGVGGLTALLLTAALCGALAASSLRSAPAALRLGVILPEQEPCAAQLYARLSAQEGLEVLPADAGTGTALLSAGRLECLLTVGEGYGNALAAGSPLPLRLQSAPGSSSLQAVREMVAGQATAQRAFLRGLSDAETFLGRPLSQTERQSLLDQMTAQAEALGPLYTVRGLSGAGTAGDPFAPGPLSFALLAVLLTALTWGAWTSAPDARRVETRLASLPGGLTLSLASDTLALLLVSLAAGTCVLLFGRAAPGAWIALLPYALCVTGLSLLLARLDTAGRMDALAPFAALLTSLAGGCFGDLSLLSPALSRIALLTPQGLALKGGGALVLLAAAGVLLLLFSLYIQRKSVYNNREIL